MTGKCSLVKGVTKQPLLLLSSMLSREKQAKSQFLQAAGLPLAKLQKELKGVGSTPIRSSISTLSSNSNYSSVIGVGGTLQFHPKELEWS